MFSSVVMLGLTALISIVVNPLCFRYIFNIFPIMRLVNMRTGCLQNHLSTNLQNRFSGQPCCPLRLPLVENLVPVKSDVIVSNLQSIMSSTHGNTYLKIDILIAHRLTAVTSAVKFSFPSSTSLSNEGENEFFISSWGPPLRSPLWLLELSAQCSSFQASNN